MNTDVSSPDGRILIDIREAARLLSLSERTVHTLKSTGEIPSVKIGKSLRFRVTDLLAWAESHAKCA